MTFTDDKGVNQPLLPVSNIYKITADQLKKFFSKNEDFNVRLEYLKGNTQKLLKDLATEAATGIIGDEKDLRRRKAVFGRNIKPLAQQNTMLESIKQTLQDRLWMVAAGTAGISAIGNALIGDWEGLGEGLAVIIAIVLIIVITSIADYVKDRRFINLQSLIKDENVAVIRGKFGATQSVNVWDLVVGDIVLLDTGARIPADCIVVESADLQVTEPAEEGVEGAIGVKKNKHAVNAVDGQEDPFLLANSVVAKGTCKAVVCCVGERSSRGTHEDKLDTESDTPLQTKLKNLSDQFIVLAIYSSLAILVLLMVCFIIQVFSAGGSEDENAKGPFGLLLAELPSFLNFVVVLIIVSVPEGLPLTIGVALAFSVMKMYKDKILVRNLDAPEKMGGVDEICCGKTGTITKGDMKVASFYCEGKEVTNSRKNTLMHCELAKETIQRIQESILYNCDARVEMDTTTYVPVGSGTEVGYLRFLQDAEVPVHLLIQRKLGKIQAQSPFSPFRKRSVVALTHPDRPEKVVVYVKGAPEVILDMCTSQIVKDGEIADLDDETKENIQAQIVSMASRPLRVLSFAYAEMDFADWEGVVNDMNPDRALEESLSSGQLPLTFVGAFGLKDPLRAKVQSCIKYARDHGKMCVRMVSGDHIETAKNVAIKAGILKQDELHSRYAVMDAAEFRSLVGSIERERGDQGETDKVENEEVFNEIQQELRVLARATASDKHLLVVGLRGLNKSVAATGEGINDVDALSNAEVGIAMGSGCSAAKEAADIILLEDDFEACLRSVMWGRNIYHNISRFLQFQVTVNLSCILTVFIGIIRLGEPPINPVQLLWINLIMDTFAALALSTEPPLPQVIKGRPFKGDGSLLSKAVWRQIYGVSLWIFVIEIIIMFFGRTIAGIPEDGDPKNEYIKTYVYHSFVFMNIFNEINCRKIGKKDFNVFENLFHNWYFIIVVVGTFATQILSAVYFPGFSGVVKIERGEWGACIAVGSTVFLASAILKMTPEHWVDRVPTGKVVNEDEKKENKLLDTYNKVTQVPGETDEGLGAMEEDKGDEDFRPI